METIELKSEKTRNIIGRIPSVIIRFGNIFILLFFIITILLSLIIRVPQIQYGEIIVHSGEKPTELYLKQINHKIQKGSRIKVYQNGMLLHQAFVPQDIENLRIKNGVLWTTLDMNFHQLSYQGLSIDIDGSSTFSVEIETNRERLINYLML